MHKVINKRAAYQNMLNTQTNHKIYSALLVRQKGYINYFCVDKSVIMCIFKPLRTFAAAMWV